MSLVTIIVDDDPLVCFIQKKLLELHEFGQEPLSFSNGLLALNYLKNNYIPDNEYLLFLDINMPVMNGWDFLQEVSSEFPERNFHVIVLSSSTLISDREKAKSFHHVVDYLEKPMNPAYLGKIKEMVDSWLYTPAKGVDSHSDKVFQHRQR